VKIGDLVRVNFGYGDETIGIFLGPTKWDTRPDAELLWSRADVFWDGEIYSTPCDQIEVLNESR